MRLILLFPLSGGSKQLLFGCLFYSASDSEGGKEEHTHSQTLRETVSHTLSVSRPHPVLLQSSTVSKSELQIHRYIYFLVCYEILKPLAQTIFFSMFNLMY